MKTIRMPAPLLAAWLAALRSGEYSQCGGRLAEGGGYCCLGVLEMVADGQVEGVVGFNGVFVSAHYPSEEWLEAHGIQFFTRNMRPTWTPHLPLLNDVASDANDRGLTFGMIADAIEDCAEGE